VLLNGAGDPDDPADQPSGPVFGLRNGVAHLPEISGACGVPGKTRVNRDVPAEQPGPREPVAVFDILAGV
jgi:hypothetical protein